RHTSSTRDWSSDVCSSDLNRVCLVIETKICKDLRFRGIGGAGFLPPTDHAVGLIEVRCASYVWRNHAIIRAETLHAVDLNGKKNGSSVLPEFAGNLDHCRTAPALTIQNDACLPLLVF